MLRCTHGKMTALQGIYFIYFRLMVYITRVSNNKTGLL